MFSYNLLFPPQVFFITLQFILQKTALAPAEIEVIFEKQQFRLYVLNR